MAKKKKLTKAERKEARLRKGKQWLLTYTGSPKKMNKHYRERFHVDAVTAAKDLQELGVNYTQEQLDRIKRAEEQRLRQRRMEREAKERERLAALYDPKTDVPPDVAKIEFVLSMLDKLIDENGHLQPEDRSLICFNIQSLGDQLRPIAMMSLLEFINMQVMTNRRKDATAAT